MKIIVSAAEVANNRMMSHRIADLLTSVPGTDKMRCELRRNADADIDFEAIAKQINPEMFSITAGDDGDVIVWISPVAMEKANELIIEQYSAIIEIGIALYPVIRMVKRMMGDFTKKAEAFTAIFRPVESAPAPAETMTASE